MEKRGSVFAGRTTQSQASGRGGQVKSVRCRDSASGEPKQVCLETLSYKQFNSITDYVKYFDSSYYSVIPFRGRP